jgi:PAS domain S-box-containing protein
MPSKVVWNLVLQGVAACGVFALDLWTPLGWADWILYSGLMLTLLWVPRPVVVVSATSAYSVLIVLGMILSPAGGDWESGVFNRTLGIVALWTLAGLILLHGRTQTKLGESESRLRAIVQTATDAILTIDEHGIVQSMNGAAERIFGYQAAEVVGRNVTMLMPEPYRSEHDQYIERYLRTGEARIIGIGREAVGRRKDGTVFPLDLSVSEVRLDERRLFTGIVRDITQRKKIEEQRDQLARTVAEKNKELEAIIYVASHDLRSPLVNVQGFSRELTLARQKLQSLLGGRRTTVHSPEKSEAEVETILNADIPEAVEYIQSSVAKMDTLLSGLLRVSRLGRAAMRSERLDMTRMLGEISRTLEYQLKEAGATLEVGPLPVCWGDAGLINQVFTNLLDNAIKYLDRSRPGMISVSGRADDGQAIYTVEDNGIGIAPNHQDKVFEIFHRLDPASGSGEGLGLTIVQRVLERHQGKVWVESEAGKGSRFFVCLPLPPEA